MLTIPAGRHEIAQTIDLTRRGWDDDVLAAITLNQQPRGNGYELVNGPGGDTLAHDNSAVLTG